MINRPGSFYVASGTEFCWWKVMLDEGGGRQPKIQPSKLLLADTSTKKKVSGSNTSNDTAISAIFGLKQTFWWHFSRVMTTERPRWDFVHFLRNANRVNWELQKWWDNWAFVVACTQNPNLHELDQNSYKSPQKNLFQVLHRFHALYRSTLRFKACFSRTVLVFFFVTAASVFFFFFSPSLSFF